MLLPGGAVLGHAPHQDVGSQIPPHLPATHRCDAFLSAASEISTNPFWGLGVKDVSSSHRIKEMQGCGT